MAYKDVIAIIGRPNIGKSTLFNRITKTKEAIVADETGVTRDRIYRKTDWAGKKFTLVDTGGLIPDTKDFFESKINLQIEVAMAEAKAIIFLTDSRTGITSVDELIVRKVKRAKKKIVIAVNKVDNNEMENEALEFYNLGMGEPIGISALNGRNIGELLDLVTEDIAVTNDDEVEDTRLKIAVIGKPNVGKSSMVNVFLNEEKMIVADFPGTTRDSIDSSFRYKNEEMVLIDTAGLRRKKKVKDIEFYSWIRTIRALDRSDIAILLLDAENGITKQDIDIIGESAKLRKNLILCVNKWDLIKDKKTDTAKKYEEELRYKIPWLSNFPIKFVSVKEKQRLLKLIDMAITIDKASKVRIKTSDLNDYIIPIIKRTPPPSFQSKFIKIKYVAQVASKPPIFVFFVNDPDHLKDNYKRFMEKKLREKYGLEGVFIVVKFKPTGYEGPKDEK